MKILMGFVLLHFTMTFCSGVMIKSEATTGVPREGNTTFLDGTTWCVARPGVSNMEIKTALDWACGVGMADCAAIKSDGPCYHPDTLLSHASFAFNSYYQQNGNNDVACYFGGTAALTKNNPSYGKCLYSTSGSLPSSASTLSEYKPNWLRWKYVLVVLFLYIVS